MKGQKNNRPMNSNDIPRYVLNQTCILKTVIMFHRSFKTQTPFRRPYKWISEKVIVIGLWIWQLLLKMWFWWRQILIKSMNSWWWDGGNFIQTSRVLVESAWVISITLTWWDGEHTCYVYDSSELPRRHGGQIYMGAKSAGLEYTIHHFPVCCQHVIYVISMMSMWF